MEKSSGKIHDFYCDNCGTYLGRSVSYEDGYYRELGESCWSYYDSTNKGYIHKVGHYCNSCYKKIDEEITNTLKGLGFKKEEE